MTSKDIEVVTEPVPREPRPPYIKWRNAAIACAVIEVIGLHGLVYFASWPHNDGTSFQQICGIWLLLSGIGVIGCTMAYAEEKDNWKREMRYSSGRPY